MELKIQGDIPFYPSKEPLTGERVKHDGSIVLALGEHTNHKHTITVPKLEDMDAVRLPDGGWMLTLRAEGTLTHNEHGPLTIAPGTYRVGHEREQDWFSGIARKVID